MNKKLFVLSAFSALVLCGCPGTQPTPTPTPTPEVIHVSGVTLNKRTLNMAAGATQKLEATVSPDEAADKAVVWSSSDPAVASVDQEGNVTAVGGGKATIKAASHEDATKFAECVVTVNDIAGLKNAIAGLGDGIELNVTLKKGAKLETGPLGEDETYKIVQNEKYSYSEEVGFGFAFHGTAENGAYYPVFENEQHNLESQWGVVFDTKAEFKAQQLFSGFGGIIGDADPYFDVDAVTYAFTEGDILDALTRVLELDYILDEDQGFGSVDFKIAEGGVDLTLYADAMGNTVLGTVQARAKADAAIGALDEYLTNAEKPTSGQDNDTIFSTNLAMNHNYTSEETYGGGLLEHAYVGDYTYTVSRDEGWTGQYAQYAYTQGYYYIPNQYNYAPGLYQLASMEDGQAIPAVYLNDPAKIAKAIEDGDAFLSYNPNGTPGQWYKSGGYNPVTAWSYGYNDFPEERFGSMGAHYAMRPGVKYINWQGRETTITEDYMSTFADLMGFISLFDEEYYPEYSGYVIDKWNDIEMYVTYKEGEAEGPTTVDEIFFVFDCIAHYVNAKKNADGTYTYTPDEPEQMYSYKAYYDFGETEDKFYEAIFAGAAHVEGTFSKVVGEEKTPIESLTLVAGETAKVEFALAEGFDGLTFTVASNKEAVVTYDAETGVVSAVSYGTAKLIATSSTGATYELPITVIANPVGEWECGEGDDKISFVVYESLNATFDGKATQLVADAEDANKFSMALEGSVAGATVVATSSGLTVSYAYIPEGETDPVTLTLSFTLVGAAPIEPEEVINAEKAAADMSEALAPYGISALTYDETYKEWGKALNFGEGDATEANCKSAAYTLASFLPDYLVETGEFYDDPESEDFYDILGGGFGSYYMAFANEEGTVKASVIGYVYNGVIYAQVSIWDVTQ